VARDIGSYDPAGTENPKELSDDPPTLSYCLKLRYNDVFTGKTYLDSVYVKFLRQTEVYFCIGFDKFTVKLEGVSEEELRSEVLTKRSICVFILRCYFILTKASFAF
jgi:hypothetical protein